jgi:translation elongation factor EF-1beta
MLAKDLETFTDPTGENVSSTPKRKATSVAKSTVVLGVRPADSDVDLHALETRVRHIWRDGLLWAKSQLEELCYGVSYLQMGAVVTDDVSVEDIQAEIESWGDLVASTEIEAFQRLS